MRPLRAGRTREGGFTIAEMIAVVVCLGIAAALVVPTAGVNADARLEGAADMLIADLEFAQSWSLSHGDDPCVVVFDAATGTWRLAPRSSPQTPITNPIGGLPYSTRFGSGRAAALAGVGFGACDLGGDSVLGFASDGATDQAADASIRLTSGGHTLTITVDAITGEATR